MRGQVLIFSLFTVFSASAASLNHLRLQAPQDELRHSMVDGQKYVFKNASLSNEDQISSPVELNTRGQSCLGAPRRCFKLKSTQAIKFQNAFNDLDPKNYSQTNLLFHADKACQEMFESH